MLVAAILSSTRLGSLPPQGDLVARAPPDSLRLSNAALGAFAQEIARYVRPPEIRIDVKGFNDYVGDYGPFLKVFVYEGRLWLDDHTLDAVYPIGDDDFVCVRNPWKVVFSRNDQGTVVSAELTFLRRAVVVEKTR